MKATLHQYLQNVDAEFIKQKKEKLPFNERELAKWELVRSLLKKVKAGILNP